MNSSTTEIRGSSHHLVVYLILIAAAVAAFFVIRQMGQSLTAPAAAANEEIQIGKSTAAEVDVVLRVLTTMTVIITVCYLFAGVFRRIGQPAVIGEVIAGIALGPSLLGAISPEAMSCLIPDAISDPHGKVLAALKMISQLGVMLYMFIVGLELNTRRVSKYAKEAIIISHASIIVPFVLGAGLSLWLYPLLSNSSVPFTSFALFLGVAMSITAFPVLARILTDEKMEKTDIGSMALSCAAADDLTAWCLLAFVVSVARAQVGSALVVTFSAVAYVAVMFLVVRPLATKWIQWAEAKNLDRQATPVLLIAVLCSSLATEAIGIHAVFGAFLLGAVIPHDSRIAADLSRKLHEVVTILLLPAFFAITGMNTQIRLIDGIDGWALCLIIIVIAFLGKCGGTIAAARFVGFDWRTSNALGILMNTRGLMELIVLNIGLSLGVISSRLFAMMVLMAIATTVATAPILRKLLPQTQQGV